jgi:hypothetical protein
VVWRGIDREGHRVDEPTKDDVVRGPAGITFQNIFGGSGLLAVERIRDVEWPEDFIKEVKEDETEALEYGGHEGAVGEGGRSSGIATGNGGDD